MNDRRTRRLFNLFGSLVLVAWLVLIGILIRKTEFAGPTGGADTGKAIPAPVMSGQRDWMEIFLKGEKVGYSVNAVTPTGDNYLIQEDINLKLNLMGKASGIRTVTQSIVDQSYKLKRFWFTMISGVIFYRVSGTVKGDLMVLEMGGGKEKRVQTIRLPEPPMIGSGLAHFFKGRKIAVGQSFSFPIFDPSTMGQKAVEVRVAKQEDVRIGRMQYAAFRLEAEMWGQPMTFWVDEAGTVLKEQGPMGLTLVKSSAANAPRGMEGGRKMDFYEIAAIPVDGKLSDTHRLSYLKLKIEGLEKAVFDAASLNRGRQRFKDGVIEITRGPVPTGRPYYTLPVRWKGEGMKPFLRPEMGVESDDRAVVQKAREIAEGEANPVKVAMRMMEWVYESLEKRPVLSVPSAREVLKSRIGDCNEHAVLLAALLRAVGIPSRVCVGVAYTRTKFYYHAWNECFLGKWISLDATLNQMPADVTHIKLVEGGLDQQVEIIGLINKIRFKVINYGY
jgi:hypothetical protein